MPRLRGEDSGLWHRAVRDVARLPSRPGRQPPPAPLPPLPSPASGGGQGGGKAGETPAVQSPARSARPAPEPLPPLDRFAGVDRASAERLKRGRTPVEATLDLHGLTQDEAHRALSRFVAGSRGAGRRCVLVVTGHGRTSGGILKAAVPRWLDEPELRLHLLAVTAAQPKDGGSAALYLLLRRLPR